jgi:hypothetical protein
MPALHHMIEADLIRKPLEAWAQPLEKLGSLIKYGGEEVMSAMAAAIGEMNFRLEEPE